MVENKEEKIKGIRKISTFVTADALLAAVLLVWAQLWIQPSVRLWAAWYGREKLTYNSENVSEILQTFDFNTGVGLIWTYSAVFLALLALAWVGWCTLKTSSDKIPATASGKTPALAVALFTASLIMAIINVFQSICSVAIKIFLLPNYSIWEPLSLSPCLVYSIGVVIMAIVATSACCAYKMSKN